MGRPGASGSKNAASLNACVGKLSVGGFKGPQLGRSNTQRTTNQVGSPVSCGLGCPTDGKGKVVPGGSAGSAAKTSFTSGILVSSTTSDSSPSLWASLTTSGSSSASDIRLESARLYKRELPG